MELTLKESKISLTKIHEAIISKTLPWIIKKPKVILKLSELPKTKIHPSTCQDKFHHTHLYIFTDGSKDNDKTECTAILNKKIVKKTLPKESYIFSAEACAIDLALDIISESNHKTLLYPQTCSLSRYH